MNNKLYCICYYNTKVIWCELIDEILDETSWLLDINM